MFGKAKENSKQISITGAINDARTAIENQQIELERLLAQQAELTLSITQSQQSIELGRQQLTELEIRQSQELQELEISEEVKRLRPIADEINALSKKLFAAVNDYQQRAKQLKDKPLAAGNFSLEEASSPHDLPVVVHQKGVDLFILTTRSKVGSRQFTNDSSFWKNAQELL